MLIGWIESNLTNMFTDVNEKVGTIAAEVGQTPSGWNGGVYQMIRGLSENVIVPIAGIIITFVLCYELISMITEKNNLHDMDTWMFFKWFFKAAVAIYLVTHTFDIVMAVFDIGQNVVSGAAGVIHGNTSIDIDATIAQMRTGMENMGVGEPVSYTHLDVYKRQIIHHPEVGALRSPKAPRRRAVIFRSHGLLQIKQGTLRFPCAGYRQLPFCGLAIWGHLALQAAPSRQVLQNLSVL